jgi:hypothetical protein
MSIVTIDHDNAVIRLYRVRAHNTGMPAAAIKQLLLDLETMAMRMANESATAPSWRVEVVL